MNILTWYQSFFQILARLCLEYFFGFCCCCLTHLGPILFILFSVEIVQFLVSKSANLSCFSGVIFGSFRSSFFGGVLGSFRIILLRFRYWVSSATLGCFKSWFSAVILRVSDQSFYCYSRQLLASESGVYPSSIALIPCQCQFQNLFLFSFIMSSDKLDLFHIRLNGKNYSAWEFQFQLFVKGKEL